MSIKGRVWKYGDDINTDVIFPGKYTYTVSDPNEMAQYAMEDLDSEFAKNVKENDIVVGGKNFGCGSSREQAVVCVKMSGIGAIIAKSFSRLYFRNCVNNGLPRRGSPVWRSAPPRRACAPSSRSCSSTSWASAATRS